MLRGFYTAASGIISQEKRLNAIANNIANSSTAGYKKDDVVLGTFGEHLAVRMNTYNQTPLTPIGNGVWMQVADDKYTDFEQGGFESTGRSLDMAIRGEGFFVVATPDGDRLTRDGQFALDADGYLVLPGFGRVQGQGGDIFIGPSEFLVAENGAIYLPPEEGGGELMLIGRLAIALPDDYAALEKDRLGFFIAPNYALMGETHRGTSIMQTYIERSNVNMGEEMTRMIATQRSLQAASQIVKMYDDMSEQGNTRLSRV